MYELTPFWTNNLVFFLTCKTYNLISLMLALKGLPGPIVRQFEWEGLGLVTNSYVKIHSIYISSFFISFQSHELLNLFFSETP